MKSDPALAASRGDRAGAIAARAAVLVLGAVCSGVLLVFIVEAKGAPAWQALTSLAAMILATAATAAATLMRRRSADGRLPDGWHWPLLAFRPAFWATVGIVFFALLMLVLVVVEGA